MGIPKSTSFQVLIVPQLSNSAALEIESAALILDEDLSIVSSNYYSGEIDLGDIARYQVVTRDRQQATKDGNDDSFFDKDAALDTYDFFLGRSIYYGALATQTWNDDYSFFWYYPLIEEALLGDIEEISEAVDFFGTPEDFEGTNFFEQSVSTLALADVADNLTVGVPYQRTILATGGTAPYTYELVSGALPSGITLNVDSIEGETMTQGSFEATIKATDANNFEVTAQIRLAVQPEEQIVISNTALDDANLNSAYTDQIVATGGNSDNYEYSALGLPGGLSINSSTGEISGTPNEFGSFSVTITVSDGVSLDGEKILALDVIQPVGNDPISINATALPDGTEAVAYSESRAITGGSGTYTTLEVIVGALPTGIIASIVGSDIVIAGTCNTPGAYGFSFRVTDDEGAQGVQYFGLVIVLDTDPEIPGSPTLLGTGWNGSDSLTTFPKTGRITTGSSSVVVEIDDGAGGKTPAQRLLEALSLLSTYDLLLIRNDSDAVVSLTSAITRSTAWGSEKKIFAYDDQRIRIDRNGGSNILNLGGKREHWKGFKLSNVKGADNAPIKLFNNLNCYYKLEDFHIENCESYGWIFWASSRCDLIDFVVYNMNPSKVLTGTNAGDAGVFITDSGGYPTEYCNIVRLYAHIEHGDDGTDFFGARYCNLIDCAIRTRRPNDVSGDGNGAKMGGRGRTLLSGYNSAIGCLVIDCAVDGITDNGIELPLTINQNTVYNVGNRAMDINNADGSTVKNNVFPLANSWLVGGATTLKNNSKQLGLDYVPLDPSNGDFSYSPSSPLVGAGDAGQNLGASLIAKQLMKAYWSY